jgi:hypothetical protein
LAKKNILLGVLIGEGTWGPLAAQVLGLGVGGELENGSLSVLSVGDDLKAGKLRLEDQDNCGYLPYTSSSQSWLEDFKQDSNAI